MKINVKKKYDNAQIFFKKLYLTHLSQTNPPAYILNIGTRIYIDSNILIRQKYEATVKAYYDTDVISANLSDAQPLVQAINDWVSNITDANIDQMIKDGKN